MLALGLGLGRAPAALAVKAVHLLLGVEDQRLRLLAGLLGGWAFENQLSSRSTCGKLLLWPRSDWCEVSSPASSTVCLQRA